MVENGADCGQEISVEKLVERLPPGTKLTLIFVSAIGRECRRHRVVEFADGCHVRLAVLPRPKKEPVVEIIFRPGDRIFLLSDGIRLQLKHVGTLLS
jgi:hypothetical protein